DLPPISDPVRTLRLSETGKFTSQLVKCSHHTSGEALFSKTGYVRSEIRRQSFPLTGPSGRIFELHVFFPDQFKRLERLKDQRLYLCFWHTRCRDAIMILGEWRTKQWILENAGQGGLVGPETRWMNRRT